MVPSVWRLGADVGVLPNGMKPGALLPRGTAAWQVTHLAGDGHSQAVYIGIQGVGVNTGEGYSASQGTSPSASLTKRAAWVQRTPTLVGWTAMEGRAVFCGETAEGEGGLCGPLPHPLLFRFFFGGNETVEQHFGVGV